MRILILFLFLLNLPFAARAGSGPAGHHHDHEAQDSLPVEMKHRQEAGTESGDGEHDHGAHEWQAPEEEKMRRNPIASTAQSVETGQRIFRHYCIACHGYEADGSGMHGQNLNPKAANLREMAGHHSDGDYHYKIRTGHGPMPHWGKTISDENIWHLVNYLQSLKPEKAAKDGHDGHHDHSTHKH